MYCTKCGNLNNDNAKFCTSCSASLTNEEKNNINIADTPTFSPAHSIFLIIFSVLCCGGIIGAVFAILSLVEGNKVKDYVAAGNIEMAKQAKKESNKWIKATYITWAVVGALLLAYFIFVMFTALVNTSL